ncbi:GNAT family N-acetyltransferase [Paenibacillus lutrae]|uniref:GNAT family N-acetyltransferase n=1 Tax=Paenibacillus lutrae TaxID=2078573 RepID=A0A7X3FK90_9BACL|nr:GNAT family N-acetyltransferase [Paenibacillus lutrae]MVP01289.1 GNAT family N-acetyltransferase [Paenibacillus lutrae]
MEEQRKATEGTTEEVSVQKQGNSYVLTGREGKVGEITYQMVDVGTWVIDHTYIDPRYRGHNLARQLLNMVVDEAREKGRKIIPSCSFALEQFEQNPEYADVWDNKTSTKYADPYSSDSVSQSGP